MASSFLFFFISSRAISRDPSSRLIIFYFVGDSFITFLAYFYSNELQSRFVVFHVLRPYTDFEWNCIYVLIQDKALHFLNIELPCEKIGTLIAICNLILHISVVLTVFFQSSSTNFLSCVVLSVVCCYCHYGQNYLLCFLSIIQIETVIIIQQ